jgi:RHS repeat-associated protein
MSSNIHTEAGAPMMRTLSFVALLSLATSGALAQTISKTETVVYKDDLTTWTVGQIESVTIDGVEASRTEFNASAQPYRTYSFGKLQKTYSFYANGLLNTAADGMGRTTTFENYARGIPRLIRFHDTTTRSAEVDDNGWVSSTTDERSARTCYDYDLMGRVTSTTYPSETQSNVCDASKWTPESVTFAQLTSFEFDAPPGSWRHRTTRGRLQTSTYFDGFLRPMLVEERDTATNALIYRRTTYDQDGRLTFQSYPASNYLASAGITTSYDSLGRRYQRKTTDNVTLETNVYLTGRRRQVTDADNKVTKLDYQAFDEPDYSLAFRIEGAEGQITDIDRDVFGKIRTISQSGAWEGGFASASRTFEYDQFRRPCRRNDPESGSTVWGYNEAGQVAWEATGQAGTGCVSIAPASSVQFAYDNRGRKDFDDYPGIKADIDYGYDPSGNLTRVATAATVWAYAYNNLNLRESEQAQVDALTMVLNPEYDGLGHLSQKTLADNSVVTYEPDAWGRATRAGNFATAVQYHSNGIPAGYNLGNGVAFTQTLNTRTWPEVQDTRDAAGSIQRYIYAYSHAGDLLSMTDSVTGADNLSATYDDLHRLKTASGVWGTYTYSYDTLNNLRGRLGPNPLVYNYNPSNRLSTISGSQTRNYSYNERGEIVGDGQKSFTVNCKGQLLTISGTSKYTYDGNGRRVKKQIISTGATEYALYELGGSLVATWNSTTQVWTNFVELGGRVIAEQTFTPSDGQRGAKYLHADLLGSPRMATGPVGILWREHFDPYGKKLNGINEKIGFTGHAFDQESEYTYMQARFYDAQVGRFLSTDPVHFVDDDPFTFNRYSYAHNNPYRYTDPDGEFVQFVPLLGAAVIGAAGGAAVQAYKQYKATGSVKFDRNMAAAAGKGALAGVGALVGGAGFAAVATASGAGTAGVLTATVAGNAYGAGLTTLATSQAVDIAAGVPRGSAEDVIAEAKGAALGGAAGAVAEKFVQGAAAGLAGAARAGTVLSTAVKTGSKPLGKLAGEAADNAGSETSDRTREDDDAGCGKSDPCNQ